MSQSSKLVDLATVAAKTADIAGLRRYLSELRSHLHNSGAPIGDRDAMRLIEALCDTPALDKVPTRFERTQSELIKDIDSHASSMRAKSDHFKHEAEIRRLWSEVEGFLSDAGAVFETPDVEMLVKGLRRARTFDLLGKTTDRLLARGYRDNGLTKRMYAQALIDTGQSLAGIELLKQMVGDGSVHRDEHVEALGLLGRAYKQLYVGTIDSAAELVINRKPFESHLQAAIDYYRIAYEAASPDQQPRQAINLVALSKLARQDGCSFPDSTDADGLARKLIEDLEPRAHGSPDPHVVATIAEAYFALGDLKKAAEYYAIFVNHKATGAFEIGSAVRQLEQVWRVKPGIDGPGQIVAGLRTAMAGNGSGVLTLTGEQRAAIASAPLGKSIGGLYETIVEGGKFIPFARFQAIVSRGASVARIRRPDFFAHGTGFLVDGAALSSKLEPGLYLMTNSHVISDDPDEIAAHRALLPKDARVIFEAEAANGQAKVYTLEPDIVWRSPIGRHDTTLVRLTSKVSFNPLPLTPPNERPIAEDSAQKKLGTPIAVLGHPADAPLSLSVMGSIENKDGEIVDIGPPATGMVDPVYLHYRTPTEGGNSGSPVFSTNNEKWTVIGLHHAGFDKDRGRPKLGGKPGTNFANEGIWIESIRQAIDTDRKQKKR